MTLKQSIQKSKECRQLVINGIVISAQIVLVMLIATQTNKHLIVITLACALSCNILIVAYVLKKNKYILVVALKLMTTEIMAILIEPIGILNDMDIFGIMFIEGIIVDIITVKRGIHKLKGDLLLVFIIYAIISIGVKLITVVDTVSNKWLN